MDGESELRSIPDLEAKLADVYLPFEEIVPEDLKEWLSVLARSNGTTREMLLVSALTTTSALIGKTSVEVFSTYQENGNLFFVAVAPSGAGKTPACHLGCIDPVVEHLEQKIGKSVVLDKASSHGLFNHFVLGDTVPILCIDEAHAFLVKLSNVSKTAQMNVMMERLCKCYDGDCWYVLKGSKGKCTGVSSARAALLAFTTPRQFLGNVWPKMIVAENGLADRFIFSYQKKEESDLEAMAEQSDRLKEFPVQSLKAVLEQVYAEHNNDTPPVKYTLDATAREAFFKFSKPAENMPSASQVTAGAEQRASCTGSKRNKHVLRLALCMHVLFHRLQKALDQQTGPTERRINVHTLNMAIAMTESLETFKGMSEIVSIFVFVFYFC